MPAVRIQFRARHYLPTVWCPTLIPCRLAWKRADCAAVVIASHQDLRCVEMSYVEMGVRRGRYMPSLRGDP